MRREKIKKINRVITIGMLLSTVLLCLISYFLEKNPKIFLQGIIIYGSFFCWFFLYSFVLQKELELFTERVCITIDEIQKGKEISDSVWQEDSIFAHMEHRLIQLYHRMQQSWEEVRKEKKELLSLVTDISHQLKTPMTNVKMINETMLRQEILSKQQKEFLYIMGTQLDKLNFLMSSMIETSRLETGVMELQKDSVHLQETLANAIGQIYRKAKEKRMEIMVECSETVVAVYDRKWTEEVFFNILDNAVKYTPEYGRIKILVLEQELYVRIDIADNGIGIEEKNQGAVFQRFYREKEVHDIEGIGIGLYLARKIITMQGGYILLRSEKGKGSCFSIYLLKK